MHTTELSPKTSKGQSKRRMLVFNGLVTSICKIRAGSTSETCDCFAYLLLLGATTLGTCIQAVVIHPWGCTPVAKAYTVNWSPQPIRIFCRQIRQQKGTYIRLRLPNPNCPHETPPGPSARAGQETRRTQPGAKTDLGLIGKPKQNNLASSRCCCPLLYSSWSHSSQFCSAPFLAGSQQEMRQCFLPAILSGVLIPKTLRGFPTENQRRTSGALRWSSGSLMSASFSGGMPFDLGVESFLGQPQESGPGKPGGALSSWAPESKHSARGSHNDLGGSSKPPVLGGQS